MHDRYLTQQLLTVTLSALLLYGSKLFVHSFPFDDVYCSLNGTYFTIVDSETFFRVFYQNFFFSTQFLLTFNIHRSPSKNRIVTPFHRALKSVQFGQIGKKFINYIEMSSTVNIVCISNFMVQFASAQQTSFLGATILYK